MQPRIIITVGEISSMFLSSTFHNQRREKSCRRGTCSFPVGREHLPDLPTSLLQLPQFVCLPKRSLLSPPQFLDDFCIIAPSSHLHWSFQTPPRRTERRGWTKLARVRRGGRRERTCSVAMETGAGGAEGASLAANQRMAPKRRTARRTTFPRSLVGFALLFCSQSCGALPPGLRGRL